MAFFINQGFTGHIVGGLELGHKTNRCSVFVGAFDYIRLVSPALMR